MANQLNDKEKALAARETAEFCSCVRRLILLFAAWKTLLLLIAAASPGLGYDTSTVVFFDHYHSTPASGLASAIQYVVLRLTRWDAIYFTSIAERGYVYEQEWAFGGAWGRLPALFAPVLSPLSLSPIVTHALVACCLSHIFHLLAVLVLFRMASDLVPSNPKLPGNVPFVAACLHIVSPGGLFLSAPNAESAFTFWSFAGTAIYIAATRKPRTQTQETSWPISAGFIFGLAAATRSNGILNGIVPAWDALLILVRKPWSFTTLRSLAIIILSGILIAVGFAAPQVVAYTEFCLHSHPLRPWCSNVPPSIYSWVQRHYWNVGLFRYWTLGNLPLFLLAAPMLALLVYTSLAALIDGDALAAALLRQSRPSSSAQSERDRASLMRCLRRLAVPQLAVAILSLTSFHVQIINRLAAAYPLWYILLAFAIDAPLENSKRYPSSDAKPVLGWLRTGHRAQWVVRAMVVYAVVQGGLYAAFLPPA